MAEFFVGLGLIVLGVIFIILMRRVSNRVRFDCRYYLVAIFLVFGGIYAVFAGIFNGVSSLFSPSSRVPNDPTPIQVSNIYPTSLPADIEFNPDPEPACLSWDQITIAMVGQRVCVQGTAVQVYPVKGSATTRINFSSLPNTFFVFSSDHIFYYTVNGVTHDLAAGDCVRAIDTIKVHDDGRHQIPYMQITELYRCNQ